MVQVVKQSENFSIKSTPNNGWEVTGTAVKGTTLSINININKESENIGYFSWTNNNGVYVNYSVSSQDLETEFLSVANTVVSEVLAEF